MILDKYLLKFNKNTGIKPEKLNVLEFKISLPQNYFDLLTAFNGGEGEVGNNYLWLYKAEELNESYNSAEFDSKIFIIGNNGSGEFIEIDARNNNFTYILLPMIFEYEAIIELSSDINELFKHIYEYGYFGNL